ncbi:L-histidine N(alpha)-methyltransferase [Kyrpidia tusciae]|uniref:Methyltransferase n=1 Tax=Kyrpidia tusciae (strain DSM 2912 / NBRC 15312 / T2) TaxID=562970 RepID=D5WXR4_KYRT2|nr:L-histidine N(alpha)-methyltransferase [Kyrpidia tusciae]ADG05985.1 methyltransferase [Kyrpidia tusciae DSM 2912]
MKTNLSEAVWRATEIPNLQVYDTHPAHTEDPAEVLRGLRQSPKTIHCKYFYDERGSRLFKEITLLDEYYLTRTEMSILREHAEEILELSGSAPCLVELGSVDGDKADILLASASEGTVYIPVDISREELWRGAAAVAEKHRHVQVKAVCADYTHFSPFWRSEENRKPVLLFYPGSSIGNYDPPEAIQLLRRFASELLRGDGLLIGVDTKKEKEVLWRAYNDARGITAAFNLNALQHINHTLGADFQIENFQHQAVYRESMDRIEMYLISRVEQRVHLAGQAIHFQAGERIHTENSYKYTVEAFQRLALEGGWEPVRVWTDPEGLFSVHYLRRL